MEQLARQNPRWGTGASRATAGISARFWPSMPGTVTGTVRTRACSRDPAARAGYAVGITARIERRQVLGSLISEYRGAG